MTDNGGRMYEEGGLIREDLRVSGEEIDAALRDLIGSVIGTSEFLHNKLTQWASTIVEECLKKLAAFSKPYKYIGG